MLWLVRHVDTLPVDVVLPPVIRAAQATFLVAAEPQRHTAMRAELVEQAESTVGVAERNHPFRQQLHAHRRKSGSGSSSESRAGIQ